MIKLRKANVIDVGDWDNLVEETYGRTYSFQQQDGCKERQRVRITVPVTHPEDYSSDTVPEVVNHPNMGVSFKAWLERDSSKLVPDDDRYRSPSWKPTEKEIEAMRQYDTLLWWERNFYPHVDMIINDLHAKGLLEAGSYEIDIDW